MNLNNYFFRTFCQALGVVLLSAGIGVMVNHFRPDGAPLIGDWSIQSKTTLNSGERIDISIEEVRRLTLQNKAIILDARSPEDFNNGHIEGAINLPWLSFDAHFDQVMNMLDGDHTIITYCDGENCNLSVDLAKMLLDFGFKDVKVFVNGWSLWVENKLPTKNVSGVTES